MAQTVLAFASECLGDGLPWAAAPFKVPEPNSEAPNKQKQARWGEAAQFGFCRHPGGRANAGVRFSGGAGVLPDVHAQPNFITLSYIPTRKTLRRNIPARASLFSHCSHGKLARTLPCHARAACLCTAPALPLKLWIISRSGCVPVRWLPPYGQPQCSFELQSIVTACQQDRLTSVSMVESSMKYSMIPEAGGPIKRHCNGELYWALEMENLLLTDGYAVQPVPWRQSVNARDAGRLKSQFMRRAKLPKRRCRRLPASLLPVSKGRILRWRFYTAVVGHDALRFSRAIKNIYLYRNDRFCQTTSFLAAACALRRGIAPFVKPRQGRRNL